ncbi:hypothetical protein ACWCQN_25085 [Streptomyces sp. NPDC001984]
MEPTRTDYLVGAPNLVHAVAASYQCGHCPADISTRTDERGSVHIAVQHDNDCPVLKGHVSAVGDLVRAAGVPDTFKAH